MTQSANRQRWDTDERYRGIADATAFSAAIDELGALARRPHWVAEEPELHLVPHLSDVGARGLSALRLVRTSSAADGVLTAELEHQPGDSRADIRQQAWAFIGAIAELSTSVSETHSGDQVCFDIVTGVPDSDGGFASHGHTVRLVVRPAAGGQPPG